MNLLGMSGGEWALVIFILGLVLGARGVPAAFGWVVGLFVKPAPPANTTKKG